MSEFRKVNKKFENPIDNLLIIINEKLNPYYKKLNFTPNVLTLLSFIITIIGIIIFYYKHNNFNYRLLSALLIFVGYYFDCADGNYARTYNLTSNLGDFLDHICDNIKFIFMFYVIYNINNIKFERKISVIIIIGFFTFLNFINLGCQEKLYEKNNKNILKSKTLSPLKLLCFHDNLINYVKYFGSGTLFIIIMICLLFI